MNFKDIIFEKRDQILGLRPSSSIDIVLQHLAIAEIHFENGRNKREEFLFSDVIYRTNQVFEGILKEAYEVLVGKDSTKVTPFKIEEYFVSNDIFKPKVIDYFRRYRTDWRNTSAHDFRLVFDESEAFLAISTVSAFCYVTVDQILQKLLTEKFIVEPKKSKIKRIIRDIDEFAILLHESMTRVYSVYQERAFLADEFYKHAFMSGAISAFFDEYWPKDKNISYDQEFNVDGSNMRVDLSFEVPNLKGIIEFKFVSSQKLTDSNYLELIKTQLTRYAHSSNSDVGIAIVFPSDNDSENLEMNVLQSKQDSKEIILIGPGI